MPKRSFKIKIIIPTVIVLVALVVVLNIFLSVRFSYLSDYLLNEELITNVNSLKSHLDNCKADSRAAAISIAHNHRIIKAIKERDRDRLLELLVPMIDLYQINYYTVCDNEGIVLVRTHEPESFGDSVLNQRNVRNALNGEVSSWFEPGTVSKVSVRTGVPVYDTDDALIGVISAGTRFDSDDEVENLKSIFHSEVTVFFDDTRIATTITRQGHRITGTTLDPHVAKVVIENGQEYSGDLDIMGEKYKTFYMPLFNPQDEVFAALFLGIPETEIIKALNKSIIDGIIVGLIGLAVSIVLLFFIISSISKPITELSADMDLIANGNLQIKVIAESEDEVGFLGKSLQKVADILRKLLQDINVMIAEQSKGNTDYSLDTTEFFGDYKTLAQNITELANFSMIDQLTGIPNRRSFDHRLEWEWLRATRDQGKLSILMMDVDKFKSYNDSFGHQQGDAALKTVAKIIKQSVKRSIDFCARWGGEEFIVLLPSTDSDGAVRVAEVIRKSIEDAEIPCAGGKGAHITISIGISTQMPSLDSEIVHLIAAADAGLYKAKESGRNRVCVGEI